MRHYDRPEEAERHLTAATYPAIAPDELPAILAGSALSPGTRTLLRALLKEVRIATFPGGLGLDYDSLLKTAVRPEDMGPHVQEAAAHLREQQVDLLFVPGMSGYPIGAAYAMASGVPALLLKKARHEPGVRYPPGSFVVPSYTGEGEFVMSADPEAVRALVDRIAARQLRRQRGAPTRTLHLRLGGADDIIDKGTMSVAVSESAVEIVDQALRQFVHSRGLRNAAAPPVMTHVEMVAWATPLMKGYNRPHQLLLDRFGIAPFAGVSVEGISEHPPGLTIAGIGTVALP
jgi:hypothetical protein